MNALTFTSTNYTLVHHFRNASVDLAATVQAVLIKRFGTVRAGQSYWPRISRIMVRSKAGLVIMEIAADSLGPGMSGKRVLSPDTLAAFSDRLERPVWGLDKFPKFSALALDSGTWLVTSIGQVVQKNGMLSFGEPVAALPMLAMPSVKFEFDLEKIERGSFMFPMGRLQDGIDWFESLIRLIHVMVIGESGSGKSNLLKGMLLALTNRQTPDELQIAMCSAKGSQFGIFEGLPHVWTSEHWNGRVATKAADLIDLTRELLAEFDRRDAEFKRYRVDNLMDYRQVSSQSFPRILFVADELLTIAQAAKTGESKEMMGVLASLLNIGRSHGFHLAIGITKPHFEVVPTIITQNIDNRIAFRVADEETGIRFKTPGAHLIPEEARGQFVGRIGGRLYTARSYMVSGVAAAVDLQPDQVVVVAARSTPAPKPAPVAPFKGGEELPTVEQAKLALWAVEHNEGRFTTSVLFREFGATWRANAISDLARRWEGLGWLTAQADDGRGKAGTRRVKPALEVKVRQVLEIGKVNQ